MNANFSVFVICFEAIIYLLLYNLHDCTFKIKTIILYQLTQSQSQLYNLHGMHL